MINHLVALAPDHARPEERAGVMQGLGDIVGQVEGFTTFTHCAALDRDATDTRHQTLGSRRLALGGGDGDSITAVDIDAGKDSS